MLPSSSPFQYTSQSEQERKKLRTTILENDILCKQWHVMYVIPMEFSCCEMRKD